MLFPRHVERMCVSAPSVSSALLFPRWRRKSDVHGPSNARALSYDTVEGPYDFLGLRNDYGDVLAQFWGYNNRLRDNKDDEGTIRD